MNIKEENLLKKMLFHSVENMELANGYIEDYSKSLSGSSLETIERNRLVSANWESLESKFRIRTSEGLKEFFKEKYSRPNLYNSPWESFPEGIKEKVVGKLWQRINSRSLLLSDLISLSCFLDIFSSDFRSLVEKKDIELDNSIISKWKEEYFELVIRRYEKNITNKSQFDEIWKDLKNFFDQKEKEIEEIIAEGNTKSSLQKAKDKALIKDLNERDWIPSLNEEEREKIEQALTLDEVKKAQLRIVKSRALKNSESLKKELADLRKTLENKNEEIDELKQHIQSLQRILKPGSQSNDDRVIALQKEVNKLTKELTEAIKSTTEAQGQVTELLAQQQVIPPRKNG